MNADSVQPGGKFYSLLFILYFFVVSSTTIFTDSTSSTTVIAMNNKDSNMTTIILSMVIAVLLLIIVLGGIGYVDCNLVCENIMKSSWLELHYHCTLFCKCIGRKQLSVLFFIMV